MSQEERTRDLRLSDDQRYFAHFITSRDDPSASGAPRLVKIRDQYERAPDPKELVILEGSAHAQFIFETDGTKVLSYRAGVLPAVAFVEGCG